MLFKLRSYFFRLPVQMVIALVLLVVVVAGAIGIPAIWLIRDQINRQAEALVSQGKGTVTALLTGQRSYLENLAILTAQRPTLVRLLEGAGEAELSAYLETLRSGADLDLVLVCSPQGEPVAQVGPPVPGDACRAAGQSWIFEDPGGPDPSGWILAAQPVADLELQRVVIVGTMLDQGFARALRDQTGLEQVLFLDGKPLAASFGASLDSGEINWEEIGAPDGADRFTFENTPYLAARARFEDTALEYAVSLALTEMQRAQRQITWIVAGGMLLIVLLSSAVGILLARRIGLPLERLQMAATRLKMGDLNTPVSSKTKMREIAQVSAALEDARIALQHSLTTLRQEKAWTDHLLESVTEGIVTLDRFGRITYFSPGAERISGWSQGQVIGKPVDEVLRMPEDGASFRQSIGSAKDKQILATVRLSGRQATLAVTGANLAPPAAGRAGTALVFRDVSDEEALRRVLGDFLANITHEFRTPLSALAASIELLLDQLPTLSLPETEELLEALRLGIVNLQTLIDNLLEGASIEAGRFRVHTHPVELAGVIAAAAQTMQPLVEKYGQRLVSELPPDLPPVQADPRRTGQVLVNLLSNAVKWSPSGAELLLYAEAAGREAIISVADRGPGVPPDQKASLFNRFTHLRSDNQRAEAGAGLGLSVVKAIVEAQGGRVSVSDRAGGGSIFQFTIPFVETSTTPEAALDESAGR